MARVPRKSEIRKKDLQRAVDGELTKKETQKLKAVLREDPQARAEYDGLKAVADTTQEVVRPVEPPANFKNRVLEGLRNLRRGLTGR